VQPATALIFASLLAKVRIIASIFMHRTWAHSSRLAGENFTPSSVHRSRSIFSQQAGWRQKQQQAARTPNLRFECQQWGIHTCTGEAREKFGLTAPPFCVFPPPACCRLWCWYYLQGKSVVAVDGVKRAMPGGAMLFINAPFSSPRSLSGAIAHQEGLNPFDS